MPVSFPVSFVVVLVRLHLEARGYYAAGGLLVGSAALLVALDGAGAAKRDRAVRATGRAQQAYDEARMARDAG